MRHEIPLFNLTWRFIALITTARQFIVCWARYFGFKSFFLVPFRSIVILSCYLSLFFSSDLFLSGFITEGLMLSSSFPRVLMPKTMFYLEKSKPCVVFFSGSLSLSPSDTQTILSCLYWGTSNLYSFLNIEDLPYNNNFVRLERCVFK